MQSNKTVCKDCAFAVYEEKTQKGCALDRIVPLVRSGGTLIEAYDEEKEFYIIDGKLCRHQRTHEWLEKQANTDYMGTIRKEIRITYQAIVWVHDNLQSLSTTIKSLNDQALPPTEIYAIRHMSSPLRPAQIVNLLKEECKCKWYNQNPIIEDSFAGDAFISVVDDVVKQSPTQFYAVFQAGCAVPPAMFNDLDIMVNDEDFVFGAIVPNESGSGLIVSSAIHRFLMGNLGESIVEKIRKQECEKPMIYQVNDLFSYFPK